VSPVLAGPYKAKIRGATMMELMDAEKGCRALPLNSNKPILSKNVPFKSAQTLTRCVAERTECFESKSMEGTPSMNCKGP